MKFRFKIIFFLLALISLIGFSCSDNDVKYEGYFIVDGTKYTAEDGWIETDIGPAKNSNGEMAYTHEFHVSGKPGVYLTIILVSPTTAIESGTYPFDTNPESYLDLMEINNFCITTNPNVNDICFSSSWSIPPPVEGSVEVKAKKDFYKVNFEGMIDRHTVEFHFSDYVAIF